MKKIAIALVCMIMTVGVASAEGKFTFGPKVGFDLTNFWGKNIKHGMQANYQVGAFAEYQFHKNVAIAPEVVFASQGGKFKADGVTSTFTTNYINIPVMMKFYVIDDLSIDFGPQIGFNVYSKYTSKASSGGAEAKVKTDIKDATNTVDFGLGLGATYNLSSMAFVQARYTMGLTHVLKNTEIKNGNIQIAFGLRF